MDRKNTCRRNRLLAAGVLLCIALRVPHVFCTTCAGDINLDGKVSVLDLDSMNAEMGRKDCFSTPCQSDLNGDGEVNTDDRALLRSELGRNDCLGAGETTETGVPEGVNKELGERSDADDAAPETKSPAGTQEDNESRTARFNDNGDGTVSDPAKGLMWTKDANLPGDTLLFHQALDYIEHMNSGKVQNFGHTDWRLPTLEELRSLIDYTRYTVKGHELPPGHPFEDVQSLRFDTYNLDPTYLWRTRLAWIVSLYCRIVGSQTGECTGYVWPVRGGE